MPLIEPSLLKNVQDIADSVGVASAKDTMAALGFLHLEAPIRPHGPIAHLWVHHEGLIVGAAENETDSTLNNIRMGGLLGFGWGEAQKTTDAVGFLRGQRWFGSDAQAYLQFTSPMMGPPSVISCLQSLSDSQARILPFSEWEQLAQDDKTRFWLFVFGNETLQDMAEHMDVSTWMGQADPALGVFVRKRIDNLLAPGGEQTRQSPSHSTPINKEIAARDVGRLQHIRLVAGKIGLTYPGTAESQKISNWLAEAGSGWKPDYETFYDALNQGSLLAIGCIDQASQQRMLKWIREAPIDLLDRITLKPDPTGQNLTSLLIKSMVDFSEKKTGPGAMEIGVFTARCLGAITLRIGHDEMHRALHLDGNPIGQILGARLEATNRNLKKENLARQTMQVLTFMDEAGIRIDGAAVVASFQPPVVIGAEASKQKTWIIERGEEQLQVLANAPASGNWAEVVAKVQAMSMEAGVGPTIHQTRCNLRF